eukprot:CAMPEP_0174726222 /NCGR_PEP_ID=MMETSP1094-20130205/47257_1 /TAXON_ID=156173 /ORGANISM="Chrysochromulina brevifilum, Strain UTEX LB 985" /LENGTH=91 /DNA_ID=CAMNT_0015927747 /DNA_START=524 /DNA_END=795 /DNA_ORIENTATION=-
MRDTNPSPEQRYLDVGLPHRLIGVIGDLHHAARHLALRQLYLAALEQLDAAVEEHVGEGSAPLHERVVSLEAMPLGLTVSATDTAHQREGA